MIRMKASNGQTSFGAKTKTTRFCVNEMRFKVKLTKKKQKQKPYTLTHAYEIRTRRLKQSRQLLK